VRLACGVHEAVVAPAAGGRILRLSSHLDSGVQDCGGSVEATGGVHDWLVPVEAAEWAADAWPKGGIFPLAPFSNRIRDGSFAWEGRSIVLDRYPGQDHVLHGTAQENAWTVIEQAPDWVLMDYTHPAGGRGWPWSWRARQLVRLREGGLRLTMDIENLSGESMPLGMGFHPYFTAQRVDVEAATSWDHEREIALRPRPNTRRAWERGTDTWTAFLSDWTGRCALHWQNGLRMDLDSHGTMSHVVLHSTAGRYLCVEPVTHVCDGLNLAAQGHAGTGVRALAPGRHANVELELTWARDLQGRH
jgi:aldose 1-epimerase